MAFVLGCSTGKTWVDYDPVFDFSGLHTYAWLERPLDSKISIAHYNQIVTAVNDYFAAREYTRVEKNPDFLIAVHGAVQQKTDAQSWGYNWGWFGGWWSAGGPAGGKNVYHYPKGSLAIDIIDPVRKELVWRGTGSSVMAKNATEKMPSGKVSQAIAKILSSFPPN